MIFRILMLNIMLWIKQNTFASNYLAANQSEVILFQFMFSVKQLDGREVALSAYQGKVLLVVNTAGFTPHYTQLQGLCDACRDQGVEILDFPCNHSSAIRPRAPMMRHIPSAPPVRHHLSPVCQIDVRGEKADPLFQWISQISQFDGFGMSPMGLAMRTIAKKMDKDYKRTGKLIGILQNFSLIGKGTL